MHFSVSNILPYCDLKAADLKDVTPQTKKMQKSAQEPQLPPLSARDVLAANVVHLRAGLGYSQEDLAFEAGLHRTFIAHVERRARNISLDNVERLAIALRVQVHELLMPMDKQGMRSTAMMQKPSRVGKVD